MPLLQRAALPAPSGKRTLSEVEARLYPKDEKLGRDHAFLIYIPAQTDVVRVFAPHKTRAVFGELFQGG